MVPDLDCLNLNLLNLDGCSITFTMLDDLIL